MALISELTVHWLGYDSVSLKLRQIIDAQSVVPGTTQDGKAWCLKALHPADPLCDVKGLPDQSSVPTVFQNFQQQATLQNPTPATAGTWSMDIFTWEHPLIFASIRYKASSGAVSFANIINTAISLPTATYSGRVEAFYATVERYRLAYMSTTGHLDCNATANSGSVAAAQYAVYPQYLGTTLVPQVGSRLDRLVEAWVEVPKTYSQLMTMPNAYSGKAEDGHYMPMRLTSTHQVWHNARQVYSHTNQPSGAAIFSGAVVAGGDLPVVAGAGDYPYGLATLCQAIDNTTPVVHERADVMCGHVSYTNLAQTSSVVLTIRAGYEMQVSAASSLASFQRLSPAYDPTAIAAYFAISRELKDAYPEEYNSLGQLLKDIAIAAGETLSQVIPGGKLIWGAAKSLFPSLLGPTISKTPEDLSAAQKEKVASATQLANAIANVDRSVPGTSRKRTLAVKQRNNH